jgi:hypothetical protein
MVIGPIERISSKLQSMFTISLKFLTNVVCWNFKILAGLGSTPQAQMIMSSKLKQSLRSSNYCVLNYICGWNRFVLEMFELQHRDDFESHAQFWEGTQVNLWKAYFSWKEPIKKISYANTVLVNFPYILCNFN